MTAIRLQLKANWRFEGYSLNFCLKKKKKEEKERKRKRSSMYHQRKKTVSKSRTAIGKGILMSESKFACTIFTLTRLIFRSEACFINSKLSILHWYSEWRHALSIQNYPYYIFDPTTWSKQQLSLVSLGLLTMHYVKVFSYPTTEKWFFQEGYGASKQKRQNRYMTMV